MAFAWPGKEARDFELLPASEAHVVWRQTIEGVGPRRRSSIGERPVHGARLGSPHGEKPWGCGSRAAGQGARTGAEGCDPPRRDANARRRRGLACRPSVVAIVGR